MTLILPALLLWVCGTKKPEKAAETKASDKNSDSGSELNRTELDQSVNLPTNDTGELISKYEKWVHKQINTVNGMYARGEYGGQKGGVQNAGLIIAEEAKRYFEIKFDKEISQEKIVKYLEIMSKKNYFKDARQEIIFRNYLPIPAETLDLIFEHLPAQVLKLPPEDIVAFICFALAIMHQESQFSHTEDITPGDGAVGIMQVNAETAQFTMQYFDKYEIDLKQAGEEIIDIDCNVELGLKYLYYLFCLRTGKYLFDDKSIVAAAYNGGPNRAKRQLVEAGKKRKNFIDMIKTGNNETKIYQRSVLAKYFLYKKLYEDQLFVEVVNRTGQ